MLISCEKCSTTYELDEKLIPSAGAAVQCTRCSHVFTAYPPAPALDAEPTTSKRRPAAAGVPQSRPANQTMVFGTGPAAEPQAPAQRPVNQTMVFGTQAPVGAPPSPQAAPRPANQTMVFGTAAGQQAAQAPAPKAPAANQTLVFGSAPVAAPAPPTVNQTMVFGTPAGQQAASREPAPVKAPAVNQTLVFGTRPPAAAPAPNQTMVFGTPAGQQLATGPQQPAAPAANQTLVFGASPGAAPKGPAATMVFGTQPAPPPPAAGRAVNQTMMFGKPPEVAAPAVNKTMAFGTPVVAPLPQVTADEGEGEPEARAESTVRVDLERMMREHGDEAGEESVEQRHDRTQRFAMSDGAAPEGSTTPGDGSESVQERHDRTALFAMSTLQETTRPDGKPGPNTGATDQQLNSVGSVSLDGMQTLPPDGGVAGFDPHADPPGVSTLMEPGGIDVHATLRNDGPIASTMPNLPPILHPATDAAHRATLPLSLVSDSDLGSVGTAPDRQMLQIETAGDAAAVEALAAQSRRRNVIAIVVVLLVVLLVALGVAWQLFGKQLLSMGVDPETQQVVVQALERFRQEDAEVRDTEIARLTAVVQEHPTFTDGHAALVLGLALEIDDLRAEYAALVSTHGRLTTRYTALAADPKQAVAAQALGKRVNVLSDRSRVLKTNIEQAWARLDAAVKSMDAVATKDSAGQLQRARTFFAAQQGRLPAEPEGLDRNDYWLRLAPPIAALNAVQPSSNQLSEALVAVNELRTELPELPRPHFVAARLHVALGEDDKAIPELEKAVAHAANFRAAIETRKALEPQ